MINIARALLGAFLLAVGSSAWADTIILYYADGSTAERPLNHSTQSMPDLASALGGASRGGADITLNTSVEMRDTVMFDNINVANPGQEVNFSTFFNRLDTLEVPFPDLVGRILITGIFVPTLGIQSIIQTTIESDDGNLIGIGINSTIPIDAPLGPFPLVGLNRITGFSTTEDTVITARLIAAAEEALAGRGTGISVYATASLAD